MSDDAAKNRRVFGKGFKTGFEAGKEHAMSLSASRAKELEAGMTGVERKVYEALMFDVPLAIRDVCSALTRAHGSSPALNIVQGCLHNLCDRGLAKRSGDGAGVFVRERVKEKPALKLAAVPGGVIEVDSLPHATTRIAETLMERHRRLTNEILERLGQLEECAKATEDERERDRARLAKAEQLATALENFRL